MVGCIEGVRASADDVGFGSSLLIGIWAWSVFAVPFFALLLVAWWMYRVEHVAALREEWREEPSRISAALLCTGVGAFSLAYISAWCTGFVGDRVKDSDLVGPAVAIVTAGALVGIVALFTVSWGGLRRLFDWFEPRVAQAVGLIAAIGLPLWVLYDSASILAKDVRWDPVLLLFTALLVSGVSVLWGRGQRATWSVAVGLMLLVAGAGITAPGIYGGQRAAQVAFEDAHGWTPMLVQVARGLVDADGDGFSPILGGGDCRDDDATISPLGVDIPGNGLDEDCRDGDRKALVTKPPAALQRPPLDKKHIKRWNVLLVTIDALRPDHLDLYGYERETAPNLTILAKNGLTFERAYAPSNATRYTIPPMFSGRPLADMNVERMGGFLAVGPGNELLFERLQGAGWQTSAHLPRQLMRGMWLGLNQGFDAFEGHAGAKLKGTSVSTLTKAFKTELGRVDAEKPWAMWLHLIEPHEPYRRHKNYPFGTENIDKYDAEIRSSDSGLGRMVAELKKRKMHKNTIIVVTSDHGEEFYEHGRRYHGKQLYEESVRVPLIIHIPGAPEVRVDEAVTLLDIPETIGQLTGLKAGPDYGALSLAPALGDWRPPADRPIMVECLKNGGKARQRQVALIRDRRKTIVDLSKGKERMFDLRSDPAEKKDLSAKAPGQFAADLSLLRKEVDRQEQTILKQLKARRVSGEPPKFLRSPVAELPGLKWWGGHTDTRVLNGENMLQVRNWFEATGDRKNYRFQLEIVDGRGKVRRKWRYALLSGMYPTNRWSKGEVVEDARLMRFRKLKGSVRLRMTIYDGKKRLIDPIVIGVAKTSKYY